MTATHDPASDDAVAVAADLTIRQHQVDDEDPEQQAAGTTWRPGTCRQCREDGSCPQLAWALSEQQRLHEQAQARIASSRRP